MTKKDTISESSVINLAFSSRRQNVGSNITLYSSIYRLTFGCKLSSITTLDLDFFKYNSRRFALYFGEVSSIVAPWIPNHPSNSNNIAIEYELLEHVDTWQ